MSIKHVHGSTTSLNGCKVDVDGDIEYSLIPLRITGFHGMMHLCGEEGYPNRDLYFGIEPKSGTTSNLSLVNKEKSSL
jgi:hypothetical protein